MGLFARLIGGVATTGVTQTLNGIGDAAVKIRTAITGDLSPDKKAEIEKALIELDNKIIEATSRVNEAEAKSGSFFVAGWRPGIGWVCVVSLALYYWPRFVLGMTLWTAKSWVAEAPLPMPDMGIGDILGLVGSLLGMATLRSWEKKQGVHEKH